MSSTIPENHSADYATSDDFAMYADEFGVLRYAKTNSSLHQIKHSPIVKNSEVSVSNIIIDNLNPSDRNYTTRIDDFESAKIAHSFYVSRYFTILPVEASNYNGLERSARLINPERYNIKVVDSSGRRYVDSFGRDRYEIYVEKYPVSDVEDVQIDYFKVIVSLDADDPVGLQLVYDKFERNADGIPFNQFLGYKEYINSLPVYSYVVEESEVIDPSSMNKRVYSTQLFSHKENKLLKNENRTNDEGWKIVTPKKAIQDPRTFQNFTWRLLAKITYDFSKIKDINQSTERAVLRTAVLYSGLIENMHNPYVFANLEESVINQQNFLFENPLAPSGTNKTQRAYWALNVDTFMSTYANQLNTTAYEYDVIVWTPISTITENQKKVLDSFLANGVSVFLDCSMLDQNSLTASGLLNFDYTLTATSRTAGYLNMVQEYVEGDEIRNGLNGWDLNFYQETSSSGPKRYGIFGPRTNRLNNDSIIPMRVFNGTPESKDGSAQSMVTLIDGSNKYTAILKDKYNYNSEFSSFSVVCLNPFLTFINDNYGVSGIGVAGSNRGAANVFPVGTPGSQTASLSEAVLGPNKFFYNILCESNKNRLNSRTKFSENSTVIWNVSPWRNSWVINGKENSDGAVTVLFEEEKKEFLFKKKAEEKTDATSASAIQKFCRELESSIGDLLIDDFEGTPNVDDALTIINADFSNVDFYIECTNNNVNFLNFSKVDNTNYLFGTTKTAYNIFKMSTVAKQKLSRAALPIDAYTDVISREFDIKSIYFPYMILDYLDVSYNFNQKSSISKPKEYLPGSQFIKDYDFDFKTQIFVTQTRTIRNQYKVSWYTEFNTPLNAKVGNLTYQSKKGIDPTAEGIVESIQQENDEKPIVITNSNSPFKGYKYPTNAYSSTDIRSEDLQGKRSLPINSFHYTFDIPRSGYNGQYERGASYPTTAAGGGGGFGGGGGGIVSAFGGATVMTNRAQNNNAEEDPEASDGIIIPPDRRANDRDIDLLLSPQAVGYSGGYSAFAALGMMGAEKIGGGIASVGNFFGKVGDAIVFWNNGPTVTPTNKDSDDLIAIVKNDVKLDRSTSTYGPKYSWEKFLRIYSNKLYRFVDKETNKTTEETLVSLFKRNFINFPEIQLIGTRDTIVSVIAYENTEEVPIGVGGKILYGPGSSTSLSDAPIPAPLTNAQKINTMYILFMDDDSSDQQYFEIYETKVVPGFNNGKPSTIAYRYSRNLSVGTNRRWVFSRALDSILSRYKMAYAVGGNQSGAVGPAAATPPANDTTGATLSGATLSGATVSEVTPKNLPPVLNPPGPKGPAIKNDYVLYIQYTLKKSGISVNVDGIYDNCISAVRSFQSQKSIPSDGVVDSETKSVLATYWLNLYKYDKAAFDREKADAPVGARPYIDNAVKYSDIGAICNPSSTDEYRRISYTGFEGPTRIQDFIVVKIPQLRDKNNRIFPWQELIGVNIRTGGWNLGVRQVLLYEQELASTTHQIPQIGNNAIKATPQNIIPFANVVAANSSATVPTGNKRKIKYAVIEVYGDPLRDGVHGPFAEGFSIRDITFTIKTPTPPNKGQRAEYTVLDGIPTTAVATGTMYGEVDLRAGDYGVFNLGTIAKAIERASASRVTDINLKTISLSVNPLKDGKPIEDADGKIITKSFSKTFDEGVYNLTNGLDSSSYNWEQDGSTVVVDPISTGSAINNANPIILSVVKIGPTGNETLSAQVVAQQFAISANRAPQYLVTTTNGVQIISTEISREYEVDNFYLADADSEGLRYKSNVKSSVNAKDGVVVLTNSVGNKIGFPDYSSFAIPDGETSFGNTILKWSLKDKNGKETSPPDGLQWGFYNIRKKQFLGDRIGYQYYIANAPDIYIGVLAFDADRDASTIENIIGVENRSETLVDRPFPAKSICPLYSVRVSSRAKIAVSNPPNNLSKFDTWFVNLSRGRFYKQINVPMTYEFTNWMKNYKGMSLRCFYDTTQMQIPSSAIFGSGYYDIWEENPIILSDREVQLRHGSFLVVQQQTDKQSINDKYTDAAPFDPWFDVEILDSNGNWQLIDKDIVRDYNKHTGVISFSKEIVPSDEKNIRVNYTVKNPNIMMYHVDGKEIPLNPYVNFTGLKYDNFSVSKTSYSDNAKPIHFYILPSIVEKMVDGEYVLVEEYVAPSSVVGYTNNYGIFSTSSVDYNPFALHIGSAVINNTFNLQDVAMIDLRVKGGGIAQGTNISKEIDKNSNILSFNDIKSGRGKLYPNGGYVIVRIPSEVRNNFRSVDEIYGIVRANLTAGVAFDIQDMDGNDWRTL